MHFNIEVISRKIKKFSSLKMKDMEFNVHQLPSNQLTAAQSSLVSNSDHSWKFLRTKKKHKEEGEALWLFLKTELHFKLANISVACY